MSFLDSLAANTIGVVWRAGTGTVDPWTKEQQIQDATANIVTASNGTISANEARAQAESDVTTTLKTQPKGSADPSDASFLSNNPGVENALNWIKTIGVFVVIGLAAFAIIKVVDLVKES